jgi:hypothetical protein
VLDEKDAKLALSVMDSRGTKFIVTAEYPPEKQKIMEDKLFEEAAKHGLQTRGSVGQMGFSFTLDEALDYFKGLKELQNHIEAAERAEKEGSGPQLSQ